MDESILDIEVSEGCREGFDSFGLYILVFLETLVEDKPDAILGFPSETAAQLGDCLLKGVVRASRYCSADTSCVLFARRYCPSPLKTVVMPITLSPAPRLLSVRRALPMPTTIRAPGRYWEPESMECRQAWHTSRGSCY